VRLLVRTEVGLVVAFAAGLLVAYVGLAVCISGRDRLVGFGVLVLGLWVMVSAPVAHDRAHRERGEAGHALWGRDDRRKPPWGRVG
jgi:high-affinity Fe2+/Pb2+ permease